MGVLTVGKLEAGLHHPRTDTLQFIAEALGVSSFALQNDGECLRELGRVVGVQVHVGPASLPEEVSALLAAVGPERRAAALATLRGLLGLLDTGGGESSGLLRAADKTQPP